MKYLLIVFLMALNPITDLNKIAKINKLKKEAKEAYNQGKYQKALDKYRYLTDSMQVEDENIKLNTANAYYQLKDTTNAIDSYQSLTASKNKIIKSVAEQQLGIIANKTKKFKEALEHFKQALKADPTNEDARYNYELLKKILEEQEKQKDKNKDKQDQDKQDKKDQDKDQEEQQKEEQQEKQDKKEKGEEEDSKEQQEKEKGEKSEDEEDTEKKEDGEKGDETAEESDKPQPIDEKDSDEEDKDKKDQMSSISEKLEEMKISQEKAKMILEALRNKEIQYYQQNKKKATKRPDADKPDW